MMASERAITGTDALTPSRYQAVPPTTVTIATCGQPPTRRVHCMMTLGWEPSSAVCTGSLQMKRLFSSVRQSLRVASSDSVSALAGGPLLMRALGCSQVPQ